VANGEFNLLSEKKLEVILLLTGHWIGIVG
jgi:hypothetical protein